jgi:very-short-patch-repair endonuclease
MSSGRRNYSEKDTHGPPDLVAHDSPDLVCARQAATQYSLISRAQALKAGISKGGIATRVTSGKWERVLPAVYRLAGSTHSWHQDLLAACLWLGPAAVASHRSAAALWGLDGSARGIIEVTVARKSGARHSGIVLHCTQRLPHSDRATCEGIPVTTVSRTLLDLGSVVGADEVQDALDHALRTRATSIPRLRWHIERLGGPGGRGSGVLRGLLDDPELGPVIPDSVLERRLLRALREAGLPVPARQHVVRDKGVVVAVLDFAYPEARIAIEADSYRFHSSRTEWRRHRTRHNQLAKLDWRVLVATWEDLRSPHRLIEEMRAALEACNPKLFPRSVRENRTVRRKTGGKKPKR